MIVLHHNTVLKTDSKLSSRPVSQQLSNSSYQLLPDLPDLLLKFHPKTFIDIYQFFGEWAHYKPEELSNRLLKDNIHRLKSFIELVGETSLQVEDDLEVESTSEITPEEIKEIDGLNIGRNAGYFGGLIGAMKNTFNGDIDEIRVWSRVLSEAEIKASYNSGQGSHIFRIKNQGGADSDWTMIGANAADQYVLQEP